MEKETKENTFKIICPWCNAPYTAEMNDGLSAAAGCPTCGDASISGTIDIICTNCKKLVYRKEY